MMANPEGFHAFDFNSRRNQFDYAPRGSWPMQNSDMNPSHNPNMGVNYQRSTTPILLQSDAQIFPQTVNHHAPAAIRGDWHMTPDALSTGYALDTSSMYPQQSYETYGIPFQTTSPIEFMPSSTGLNTNIEGSLEASLLDESYHLLPNQITGGMSFNWQDLPNDLLSGFNPSLSTHGASDALASQQTYSEGSPSDNYLEVRSLTSSSSDNGWAAIDYVTPQVGAIFNPEQTLHPRTFSDSSLSDMEHLPRTSFGSYEVLNAATSPETDSAGESDFYIVNSRPYELERLSPPEVVNTALVQPIAIRRTSSPHRSSASPIARRQSRKNSVMKATKPIARRTSQNTRNDTEKRVGRRKGPLKPDQRRQAGEIRKLGACLRCRFLKKTVCKFAAL